MSDIKLFVSYKTKNYVLKSDIIEPIQTGRAIAPEHFESMLGDDVNENISYLNPKYCELSAIYWIWKNYHEIGNPDKIGFMHYRRHFLFGDKTYKTNKHGLVEFDRIDDDYLENDLCNDGKIRKIINDFDVILPCEVDVYSSMKAKTIYKHYKKNHDISHYDIAMDILTKKHPEFIPIAKKYNNQKFGYFLNMFVLKKEIFFELCEWLFPILEELDKKINYSKILIPNQKRAVGFVGERLVGMYLYSLLDKDLKVKKLPVSFVKNTGFVNKNLDFPRQNEITLALSSSNEYVPYLSVFLQSLKEHTSFDYFYEINILERNISFENKEIIKRQIENSNIKINYISIANLLDEYQSLCLNRHFSAETYSRLFIPRLLPNKNKCLYLDIDMIVLEDVEKLFNISLDDKYIGACRDSIMNALYHIDFDKMEKYFTKTLKIENPVDYFQGGVELLNLQKIRETGTVEKIMDVIKNNNFLFVDQCAFNCFFNQKVKFIDSCWNFETYHQAARQMDFISNMDEKIAQEYMKALNEPKIIHYAGQFKPWLFLDEQYAKVWWEYARKTPYYEEILYRLNLSSKISDDAYKSAFKYKINVLKYWKYKFLKNFVFGKTRKRYAVKKYIFKQKINSAKAILK